MVIEVLSLWRSRIHEILVGGGLRGVQSRFPKMVIPNQNRATQQEIIKITKQHDISIVRQETEISVRIGHEPHNASATTVIARYPDIEVFTMRSYCNRDGVVLLLVTTNAVKTSHILHVAGFQCDVRPVILIGPINRSGWAAPVGVELANAGIEVVYSYTSHKDRDRHYLVFKTSDDDRAIQVLTAGSAFQSLTSSDSQQDREMVIAD